MTSDHTPCSEPLGPNGERHWRRLSEQVIIGYVIIALTKAPRAVRADFASKDAIKADAARRAVAMIIVDYLKNYPMFGPARPVDGPSVGAN